MPFKFYFKVIHHLMKFEEFNGHIMLKNCNFHISDHPFSCFSHSLDLYDSLKDQFASKNVLSILLKLLLACFCTEPSHRVICLTSDIVTHYYDKACSGHGTTETCFLELAVTPKVSADNDDEDQAPKLVIHPPPYHPCSWALVGTSEDMVYEFNLNVHADEVNMPFTDRLIPYTVGGT